VSSKYVDLPIAEADPALRYSTTVTATNALKRSRHGGYVEKLANWAHAVPPMIQRLVAPLVLPPGLFNILITNIPGPSATHYAMGSPLRRVVPLVPISSGHSIGVAALSYAGSITFALNADRASVPDLSVLQTGIEDSLVELGEIADGHNDARRYPRRGQCHAPNRP
jgi:diacylglycerol O-acyltransferase